MLRNIVGVVVLLALLATACGNGAEETGSVSGQGGEPRGVPTDGAGGEGTALAGTIEVDGSSTVAPVTDAVAEEFNADEPEVQVNLGVSGTGGGFERFCNGETDISNASRPITDEEVEACHAAGVEYTEIRVGTDALTVVTRTGTDWVDCLTFDELATIWGADGSAATWQDVRDDFPAERLQIFAPGADSGTYDFFNEEVLGDDHEPRQDYNASEDDNIIAQGVMGTPGSWGYFGFAYYQENSDRLKAIAVDAGDGCVAPSVDAVEDGAYPLSRPLFIYVRNASLERPEVAAFVTYYLEVVEDVIADVGYIAESPEELDAAKAALEAAMR